ncbi:hypothetical protein FQN54_007940 [Arachnomyces sp. PD_36]|nr:hypothetical protein FQN54_007940 [Arachnomyces sp. PD_36]
MADKIDVNDDPRVQRCTAKVNGRNYGYLLGQPKNGEWKATIFLIHGFPDLSMTWRYQIPMLIDLGLRVVCPDCIGYGRTDAPDAVEEYTLKKSADDIKELARQLGSSNIILGGHDWYLPFPFLHILPIYKGPNITHRGGAVVYRTALWHPDLITHVFSICTPFTPPYPQFIDLKSLVENMAPQFGYQLQFASTELEERVKSKEDIEQVLMSLYGGKTAEGEAGFDVKKGVLFDKFGKVGSSKLMSEEDKEYYLQEFSRSGMHGPFNWYRTSKLNYDDELAILDRNTLTQPLLFITATGDTALPPSMSKNMEKMVPQLTRRQVDAGHWAHWQRPEECNQIIKGWIEEVVFGKKSRL